MSDLRSLSTSYSTSKFLPPADWLQQFFLLHYILRLLFLCLFLLRRLNISLLQIFSLFTSLSSSPPLTKCSLVKILFLFNFFVLLCFYWDCPTPLLNQHQNDKEDKKMHRIFLFFLLCSLCLLSYISIMPHYTLSLLTTTPLKSHEDLDPIPPFIFAEE